MAKKVFRISRESTSHPGYFYVIFGCSDVLRAEAYKILLTEMDPELEFDIIDKGNHCFLINNPQSVKKFLRGFGWQELNREDMLEMCMKKKHR